VQDASSVMDEDRYGAVDEAEGDRVKQQRCVRLADGAGGEQAAGAREGEGRERL
jgi:hypothetical protein